MSPGKIHTAVGDAVIDKIAASNLPVAPLPDEGPMQYKQEEKPSHRKQLRDARQRADLQFLLKNTRRIARAPYATTRSKWTGTFMVKPTLVLNKDYRVVALKRAQRWLMNNVGKEIADAPGHIQEKIMMLVQMGQARVEPS